MKESLEYSTVMKSVWLAATLLSFVLPASAGEFTQRPVLRFALKAYTQPRAARGVDFAADGRSLCVWWGPVPPEGDYTRLPLEFVVLDLFGNVLSVSRSATNRAISLKDFPSISWRETQQVFIKGAKTWAFSRDFSRGLRFKEVTYDKYLAEMWVLPAEQKPIWVTALPYVGPEPVSLFFDTTDRTILVTGPLQEVVALQMQTGEIVDKFSLGPIESDAELLKRKKRFRIDVDLHDPGLQFIAGTLSLDSKKQLLAAGASDDKRVRVVGIASHGQVVFEANADINPGLPWGGSWQVHRVQFLADGKYLLAEYFFGGRGTSTTLLPTEIFETRTWKVVWKKNDLEIHSVTMSPDGTKIALLRGNTLEVLPFEKR